MFVSGLLDKGPFFRNGPGRRRLRISSIRDLSGAMGFNLMVDRALCRAFAGLTLLRWGGAWRCVPRLAAGWSAWVNRARSSVWLERTPDKRKVGSSSLPGPTIGLDAVGIGAGGSGFGSGLDGAVAQLGERLLCKQEVIGSIPFSSTIHGVWRWPFSDGVVVWAAWRTGSGGKQALAAASLAADWHGCAIGWLVCGRCCGL